MMFRYVLFVPISLTANLLTILLSPLLAIWPALTGRDLPGPLWYLQTNDDDIFGSKTTREPVPDSVVGRWKRAMWWLTRNPAYGIDAYTLGLAADDVLSRVVEGDIRNGGRRTRYNLKNGGTRFEYFRDISYNSSRYMKMRFGWKPTIVNGRQMFVFDFHPFKKRS